MRVLGIDPSLTSTGIAIIEDRPPTLGGLDPLIAYTAVFKTSGKRADPITVMDARIGRVTDFVSDHATGVDLAVIEGPSLGSHGGSPWDRAGMWWRIVHRLLAAEVPVAVCPPTVRAKWATGVGSGPKASKALVAVAVARLWPNVDAESDDEWDALGMATIGAQQLGLPAPSRAQHAAQLGSVAWPELPERAARGLSMAEDGPAPAGACPGTPDAAAAISGRVSRRSA
jgi:Holliday junction resolvasome RuvABC endonuclease subunit